MHKTATKALWTSTSSYKYEIHGKKWECHKSYKSLWPATLAELSIANYAEATCYYYSWPWRSNDHNTWYLRMIPNRDISFIKTIKGGFIFTWPIIGTYLLLSLGGNLEVSKLEVHTNHNQKIPVTPQKQLHLQVDRHQIIKYTVNSASKWNVLDQELKFFCLLPSKNEDVLLLMKVCRFPILCYSLLKRRKMLIFAILTFRKLPHSTCSWWAVRLFQHKQPTYLPAKKLSAQVDFSGWRMVDRIQNWRHFNLTQSTFYLNIICPF